MARAVLRGALPAGLVVLVLAAMPLLAAPLKSGSPAAEAPDLLAAQRRLSELDNYLREGAAGMFLRRLETLPEAEATADPVLALKAAALLMRGDAQAAEALWREFGPLRPLPVLGARALAEAYLARGDWGNAQSVLQQGLINDVNAVELLLLMARAQLEQGRFTRAQAYLQDAHALCQAECGIPQLAETVRDQLASTLVRLNRHRQAREVLARPGLGAPPAELATVIEARYLASQADYNAALERLALGPQSDPVLQARAQVLLLSGDYQVAWETLGSRGQAAGPLAVLARLLVEPGESSARSARALLEKDPTASRLPLQQALLAMAAGEQEAAASWLQRAGLPLAEMVRHPAFMQDLQSAALAPGLALAYFSLDQGYFEQARQRASALREAHTDNVLPALLLAETLRLTGEAGAAVDVYRDALELLPESVGLRFQLAGALTAAGEAGAALAEYESMLEAHPDFVAGQLAYGELLQADQGWEGAREAWQWALNFKPESVPLLLAHARAVLESARGEWPAGMLEDLARRQLPPGELAFLQGRAAWLRGAEAQALSELFAAVQADPRAEWLAALATAYQELGRAHAARQLECQAALMSFNPLSPPVAMPAACGG